MTTLTRHIKSFVEYLHNTRFFRPLLLAALLLLLALEAPSDQDEVRAELRLHWPVHHTHFLLEHHTVELFHHHARLERAQVAAAARRWAFTHLWRVDTEEEVRNDDNKMFLSLEVVIPWQQAGKTPRKGSPPTEALF